MKVKVQKLDDVAALQKELAYSFTSLKNSAERLSFSFRRLGEEKRSQRVHFCANDLAFGHSEGKYKLHEANFCRERLCPMCAARRARKAFAQVYQICNKLRGDGVRFIFLTLTVVNCEGSELSATIDKMQKAFHKLVNYKRFKDGCLGFFRALEVTRNNRRRSKSYGTFHPHFHCVVAVPADYFTSSKYIKQVEWLQMWRKACKDDRILEVNVKTVKYFFKRDGIDNLARACAEVAKYTLKTKDFLFRDDDDLTDNVVSTLQGALRGRRLTAFGGCFAVVRDLLGLDDVEDGNLVHTETDAKTADAVEMRRYRWQSYLKFYALVSDRLEVRVDGVGWIAADVVDDDSGGGELYG